MDIVQVKEMFKDASYGEDIEKLVALKEISGDREITGYLGSGVQNISRDDYGNLEFQSVKDVDGLITKSTGVALEVGYSIKQTQEKDGNIDFQLFSWNNEANKYTYVAFYNSDALDFAYDKLKEFKTNLCDCDVSQKIQLLGVDFNDIADVKADVVTKNSELYNMLDESQKKDGEEELKISLL